MTRIPGRGPLALIKSALLILAAVSSLNPSDAHAARRAKPIPSVAAPEPEHVNSAPRPGDIVWGCHWNGDSAIACELLSSPGEVAKIGTDPRLPSIVDSIRNSPENAPRVSIPMHSIPYDMAMTGELAVSVMCGSRSECSVIFGRDRGAMAGEIARLAPGALLAYAR